MPELLQLGEKALHYMARTVKFLLLLYARSPDLVTGGVMLPW